MFALLWLACHKDEGPAFPVGTGESALPDTIAVLTFEGVEILGHSGVAGSQFWFSFADPAPPDLPPQWSLGNCRQSGEKGRWYEEPAMLDVGEIIVRAGGYVSLDEVEEGGYYLFHDYPVGKHIWFEASGGSEFPAFAVPELIEIPEPTQDVSFSLEPSGFYATWAPADDPSSIELFVRDNDTERDLTCITEDNGSFSLSSELLAQTGIREVSVTTLARIQTAEVIDGEVLVRGIVRYTVLDTP